MKEEMPKMEAEPKEELGLDLGLNYRHTPIKKRYNFIPLFWLGFLILLFIVALWAATTGGIPLYPSTQQVYEIQETPTCEIGTLNPITNMCEIEIIDSVTYK